jgi:uncharacterized membrane protein YdjX (TVP38/TMEM64 family)
MPRPRLLLLVAAIAALAWAYRALDLAQHASVQGLRALVEAHAPYGPLVFIGVCILGVFLHMPEIVLVAAGGILFEASRAFAYAWIATVVGATATFLLVRYVARDSFQRVLVGRFARLRTLDDRLATHGFVTVLALRLVLFMAPPLNWALGATRVRLGHYVAGTALGVVPGIATAVFFAESIASRGPEEELVGGGTLLAGLLIVGFLATAAIVSRRLLGRAPGAPPG